MLSSPLLVVTVLMLLPLIPAAIIYFLLTPKTERARGQAAGNGTLGGFQLQFNVVGSTATYVVLLAAASFLYSDLSADELAKTQSQENAIKMAKEDRQAWLVDVPVMFKNSQDKPLPTEQHQMDQVNVILAPATTVPNGTSISFWVVASNGRFPQAFVSAPGQSIKPTFVDLNDERQFAHNYVEHTMGGLGPVWIEMGDTYGN